METGDRSPGRVAQVPIACALSADDADARVAEWRRFLGTAVAEVERTGRSAWLRLHGDDATLLAAVDLARREKACCGFFELRVVPLPQAVWLEVEALEELASVLDGLVNLRGS